MLTDPSRAAIEAAIKQAVEAAPPDARLAVVELLERAFTDTATRFDKGLAALLIEGRAIAVGLNAQGELLFRITDGGLADALDSLERSQALRDLWNALGGPPMSPPPKGTQ